MDNLEKEQLEQLEKDYEVLGKTIDKLKNKNDFDFTIQDKKNIIFRFKDLVVYSIFQTGKEEEIWDKKIRALHALRIIANELNGEPQHTWIIWENMNQKKYYIYFNGQIWETSFNIINNNFGINFKTEELAEKAIEYMEHYGLLDDLKL